MVHAVAKRALYSVFARSRRRPETDISMTTSRWAELVFTSLAAVVIAFVITIAIGAASAQEQCGSHAPEPVSCVKPVAGI
jgi:hypothetical protein